MSQNKKQQEQLQSTKNLTNKPGHIAISLSDQEDTSDAEGSRPLPTGAPTPLPVPTPKEQVIPKANSYSRFDSSSSRQAKPVTRSDKPEVADPTDMTITARVRPQPRVVKKAAAADPSSSTVLTSRNNLRVLDEEDSLSNREQSPQHKHKISKFSQRGAYRKVLDNSDRLFRTDKPQSSRARNLKPTSPQPIASTKDESESASEFPSEVTSEASFLFKPSTNTSNISRVTDSTADPSVDIESSLRIRVPVAVTDPSEILPTKGKKSIPVDKAANVPLETATSTLKSKDRQEARHSRTINEKDLPSGSPEEVGVILPLKSGKGGKRITLPNKEENIIDHEPTTPTRRTKGKSKEQHSASTDEEAVPSENPKEAPVILPRKPGLSLRRTNARSKLVPTEAPEPAHLDPEARLAIEELRKQKRTKVTQSEGELRKKRYDKMINEMKEWKPMVTAKPQKSGLLKGAKKGKKFGILAEKVHPELVNDEVSNIEGVKVPNSVRRVLKTNLKRIRQAGPVKVEIGAKPKGKKGVLSSVIRVKGGRKRRSRVSFIFTTVGDKEVIDPLVKESILEAEDFKEWMRQARRSLPSTIGIPIQKAGDVVTAGLPAIEFARQNSMHPKEAYNSVYDDMQRHHHSISSRKSSTSAAALVSAARMQELLISKRSADMSTTSVMDEQSITKKVAALKFLPDYLSEKRMYKQDYILKSHTQNTLLNKKQSLKERIGYFVKQTHRFIHDTVQDRTIWKKDIHEIHGKYGLSAAAYFRWVRTILIMNIFYFLFTFAFIILPELLADPTPTSTAATCFHTEDKMCPSHPVRPIIPPKKTFSVEDLFLGVGSFEYSYVFYSGYRDTVADLYCPLNRTSGEVPDTLLAVTGFRFATVCILIFLMNTVYISIKITHFYHVARMESRVPGLTKKDHFKAVLCAWDFNCSDVSAAKASHRSIWYELKELAVGLETIKSKSVVKAGNEQLYNIIVNRFGIKYAKFILHWFANVGVVIACMLAGGSVYFSYYARNSYMNKCELNENQPPNWILALPAFFISCTTFAVSKFCVWISHFEHWDSIENKNLSLIGRVGVYYLTELGVLYGYWLFHTRTISKTICYEELFGQVNEHLWIITELYRIIVLQAMIRVGGSLLFSKAYHFYKERKDPNYPKPVFDPASLTLNILWLHTLAGFGFFYCPIISLLIIARCVLTFYHRKYVLLHFSSFPTHLSHNSEIAAPYLVVFFVTYLITSFLNVFLFASLQPSAGCGPFSHYGQYYELFLDGVKSSTSGFILTLINPGVAIVFITLLVGLFYTLRVWAKAYVHNMEKMHDLLLLEREDRDFLLKAIFNIVKKQDDLDEEQDEIASIRKESEKPRKSDRWKDMAMALGIFSDRKGSIAKQHSLYLQRNSDDAGEQIRRDSNLRSQDLSDVHEVLQDAVATRVRHHGTFRKESLDNWMQDFMTSKDTARKSTVTVHFDKDEIARRFGIEIRENEDEDEYDSDFSQQTEPERKKRDE